MPIGQSTPSRSRSAATMIGKGRYWFNPMMMMMDDEKLNNGSSNVANLSNSFEFNFDLLSSMKDEQRSKPNCSTYTVEPLGQTRKQRCQSRGPKDKRQTSKRIDLTYKIANNASSEDKNCSSPKLLQTATNTLEIVGNSIKNNNNRKSADIFNSSNNNVQHLYYNEPPILTEDCEKKPSSDESSQLLSTDTEVKPRQQHDGQQPIVLANDEILTFDQAFANFVRNCRSSQSLASTDLPIIANNNKNGDHFQVPNNTINSFNSNFS